MDILPVAGPWLDGAALDTAAAQPGAGGHRSVPSPCRARMTGTAPATLADQVAAAAAPAGAAAGNPMAARVPVARRLARPAAHGRPGTISTVALTGGFPPQTANHPPGPSPAGTARSFPGLGRAARQPSR